MEARGFALGAWKKDYAHIWPWEKTENGVVFHDPQSVEVSFERREYLKALKPGRFWMVRIDEANPVDGILDVIGGDLGQWL